MRGSVVKPICKGQAAWPGGLGTLLSISGTEVGWARASLPQVNGRVGTGLGREWICLRVRVGLMAGRAELKATCWRSLGCMWPILETVPKGLFKKICFLFSYSGNKIHTC